MVSTLVQAPNPKDLKDAIDALILAGRKIQIVTALANKSWYLVIHSL